MAEVPPYPTIICSILLCRGSAVVPAGRRGARAGVGDLVCSGAVIRLHRRRKVAGLQVAAAVLPRMSIAEPEEKAKTVHLLEALGRVATAPQADQDVTGATAPIAGKYCKGARQ